MEKMAVVRLPRSSELGAPALGLLEGRFLAREDLHMATDLASEIDRQCSQAEADLHGLKRKLGSSIVSWSSRSIHARASVDDITHSLEDLCLLSSKYGDRSLGARKIQKILAQDLPFIVKELKRIKAVREYAGAARLGTDITIRIGNDSSRNNVYVLKAVKAINIIEDLLLNIANFHPCWCHLLKTGYSRIDKNLAKLRPQILADHRGVLASLGWPPKVLKSKIEGGVASSIPNPLVLMQRDKKEKYSQSFLALCALQNVQKRRDDRPLVLSGRKKDSYVSLWAIDELASPIASRLEHHFYKWVDQPELIFILVYKIINDFIEGIDDVLQPLIDRARLVSCSAKEAWVSSMVQTLSGFLVKKVFPVLVASYKDKHLKEGAISDWLHIIDGIIAFDKRVKLLLRSETSLYMVESEMFVETSTSISVLSLFHDRPDWLQTWAKAEVKDAWKKLKSELKQERAWLSDKNQGECPNGKTEAGHYLFSSMEDFNAPPIAEYALKIAWHMIERCKNLPAISARVKFIRSGAVKILRHFFNVLLLRFQKTEFSAYDSEGAILRVCQLINVARFCESKLQEWSDDVNFLELRVSEKDLSNARVGRKMPENGSFFEEEMRSLAELQTNWLSEVVAQVLREFESYSFEYLEDYQRFEQAMESTAALVVSNVLGEALDTLRGQLLFIREHLNRTDFLDLWRSVADGLDLFVFNSILSWNARFSKEGAQQLETDLQGLFLVFGAFCSRPQAFFPCIRDLLGALKMGREDARYLESFAGTDDGNTRKWLLARGISSVVSIDRILMILRNRNFTD
ncbi:hypothetical protein V2J09_006210 [Rumex salicifolius]